MELASVFKIENQPALKKFDKRMKAEAASSVLKGLFIPVTANQIKKLVIFGLHKPDSSYESSESRDSEEMTYSEMFKSKCLRIPRQLLKNDMSVVQQILQDTETAES